MVGKHCVRLNRLKAACFLQRIIIVSVYCKENINFDYISKGIINKYRPKYFPLAHKHVQSFIPAQRHLGN